MGINDQIILEMHEAAKLKVDGSGMGTVWMFNEKKGRYQLANEQLQYGGGKNAKYPDCVYRVLKVWWKGKTRTLRIHRVIWVILKGATDLEIDHKDHDALNCGIDNLQPLTTKANSQKRSGWLRTKEPF